MPTTITSPDLETARDVIHTGLDTEHVVTISGESTIDYDGRTTSFLGLGDRLFILKPDGTLLAHCPDGHDPVNWQPPGGTHEVRLTTPTLSDTADPGTGTEPDPELEVLSTRPSPHEEVLVTFAPASIHHVASLPLSDDATLQLTGTEEDLRQSLLDDPSLIEEGFRPHSTERETTAGPVDIFGADSHGTPVVVELKRRRVGPSAVGQLSRYVEAIDLPTTLQDDPYEQVRGILVAPSITDTAQQYLNDTDFEFVEAPDALFTDRPRNHSLDSY